MVKNNTILRSIYLSYAAFFLNFIVVFIATPLILHYLGTTIYGVWIIIGSLVVYFQILDFGMNISVARYTAEFYATNKIESLNKFVSSVTVILISIGIFIVSLSFIFLPFLPRFFHIPPDNIASIRLTVVIMASFVLLSLINSMFENMTVGLRRVDITKVYLIARQLFYLLLVVIFLKIGLGIVGVGLASFCSMLLAVLLYLLFFHFKKYPIKISVKLIDSKIFKQCMPYSIRSFILSLASLLLYQKDPIVIGAILGASFVTSYAVAYNICFMATYISSLIVSVMFPEFGRLYHIGDLVTLRRLYTGVTKISVAIMMPIAIAMLFFGHSFINIWVGSTNWVGFKVFLLFVLMDLIHSFSGPSATLLQGIGKNKLLTLAELANTGLNITLSIILTMHWGVLGAISGTILASLCMASWLGPFLACRYIGIPFRRFFMEVMLLPFLAGLVVYLITFLFIRNFLPDSNFLYLGIKSILICVIYFAFYIFFIANKEERQLYRQLSPFKKPVA